MQVPAKTAKLFTNGGSQAVRLPAEFRFDGDEVYVRKDSRTGDVILSKKPRLTWEEYFALCEAEGPIDDSFMADRPLNTPWEDRDPFADEQ